MHPVFGGGDPIFDTKPRQVSIDNYEAFIVTRADEIAQAIEKVAAKKVTRDLEQAAADK